MPYWNVLDWQHHNAPIYAFDGKTVTFQGVVTTSASYRWAKYMKELGLSYWWLRLSSWSEPAPIVGVKKTVAMLEQLKDSYLRQFPKGHFVVSSFLKNPLLPTDAQGVSLVNELTKVGIEVWEHKTDYPEDRFIHGDGHPSPRGHTYQATELLFAGQKFFGPRPKPKLVL